MTARIPDVSSIKNKIHMNRRLVYKERARDVRSRLSSSSQRSMDLNSETGSSAWLTVLPLQDQGFHLNYLNKTSGMPYTYDMDGSWLIHPATVFVGHHSLLIML